ncbi:Bro-N domain-containing protein [Pseudomonas gingeri]|uniref:Bro-N domain-containing protein n=1 Tax=Pseudomonas gingeri TaxID=117681 RepID=A0A7Y8C4G9_9PSED|nr:Bro-N domain-containing protein [Pseudomonas gingeri]NWB98312.1 Bro-N domain-containing protein [Pseudomonas gingeri]NWD76817.1 Bro-N domain-containing protein [Pseudomonas gingeri]
MSNPLPSTLFTRHNIHLHALLLENQVWFHAHDIGRLMGKYLDERMSRKLDPDQRRMMWVHAHGAAQERLMLSESGVYALLVYHYCPEYRQLREWLTYQVVTVLRDARSLRTPERPTLSLLDWPDMSISLLHWQDEPWIRLRDMPFILVNRTLQRTHKPTPWWRKAKRLFLA